MLFILDIINILFITFFYLIIYKYALNQSSGSLTSDWYQGSRHSLCNIIYMWKGQHQVGR